MARNFNFILILFILFISCRLHNNLDADTKKEIIQEIKIMMNDYYNDIKTSGLNAEFKYLDSSKDFLWTPPGFSAGISFDSVASILRSNAAAFKSIVNTWDTLEIMPESANRATYTGKIHSIVTDTSGKISDINLSESGTLIKRKDGWKLLKGNTIILL